MSRECSVFSLFIIVTAIISGAYAKPPARIVSGSNAPLGEIIFQVSLRINGKHYCGGTLVSTRHVITAGHCVYGLKAPYTELTIVAGTNNLHKGGQAYRASDIELHSNFTLGVDGAWHDDIAVITLVGDIDVNTYQAPISLPDEDTPGNVVGLASGWVYNDINGFPDGEFSPILQKADMTILSNDQCQKAHKNKIDDSQICGFKDIFVGTCKSDDGSPLMHNGFVVGISSWQYPCRLGLPDVYTRVHHYLPWIFDVISR